MLIINTSLGAELIDNDSYDLKISRYWQGLNDIYWKDWHMEYIQNLSDKHDSLYDLTQAQGKGAYFKSGEIQYQPLIIWFVYKDLSVSEPIIVVSSGSKKYDKFNCDVIKATIAPDFPENVARVFMWDGNIKDLIEYLKYKGVLPAKYNLNNSILPTQIHWEKIELP